MWIIVILLLAVYGVLMLSWQIWHRAVGKRDVAVPSVIVVVDSAEDWIEWFLRKMSLESYVMGRGALDIIIVDLSASLETSMIVSKLQQSHHFVTYVSSSKERRWSDVLALLQMSSRTHSLLVEIMSEADVKRVVRTVAQLSSS